MARRPRSSRAWHFVLSGVRREADGRAGARGWGYDSDGQVGWAWGALGGTGWHRGRFPFPGTRSELAKSRKDLIMVSIDAKLNAFLSTEWVCHT